MVTELVHTFEATLKFVEQSVAERDLLRRLWVVRRDRYGRQAQGRGRQDDMGHQ